MSSSRCSLGGNKLGTGIVRTTLPDPTKINEKEVHKIGTVSKIV